MSFLAEAWADAQTPGSSGRLHLLRVIAQHYRDDEGYAWPSTKYLATKTQMSTATVERHLAALEAAKYLRREIERYGADGGVKRRIYLNFDAESVEADLRLKRARPAGRRGGSTGDTPRSPQNDGTYPVTPPEPGQSPSSPQNDGQVPSFCGVGPINLRQSESLTELPTESKNPPVSQERHRPRGATSPRAIPCPNDFEPDPGHVAQGVARGFGRSFVLEVRDRMRDWSAANAHRPIARKADWGLTFTNFLRKAMDEEQAKRDRQTGRRPSTNGGLSLLAEMYGLPEEPADLLDMMGLPSSLSRNAEALQMALRGEWPVGGSVFVAADSPEGDAWEAHYRRFGQGTKWRALAKGLGGMMPSAMPPASVQAHVRPAEMAGLTRRMFGADATHGFVIDQ